MTDRDRTTRTRARTPGAEGYPPSMAVHWRAASSDSVRNNVVLFGGYGGLALGYYSDTWGWDGESWTQLSTTGPAARSSFSMAFDAGRGKVVLFGGNSPGGTLGDTWEWDGAAWTQANPLASPPGRWPATGRRCRPAPPSARPSSRRSGGSPPLPPAGWRRPGTAPARRPPTRARASRARWRRACSRRRAPS